MISSAHETSPPPRGEGRGEGLRSLWILLSLALSILIGHGEPAADFDAANRLYEKGDFGAAAAAYQKLAANSASPALLFNLGNAHFRHGQVGRAILAYRQAEQLAPRDPDIRANLRFALGSVAGNNIRITPTERIVKAFTVNELGTIAAIAIWLWFGLLALGQVRPNLKSSVRAYVIAAAFSTILFGTWFAFVLADHLNNPGVVVTAPSAVVRFGPLEESQVSFTVRDGNELRVADRKGAWLQVLDTSNRTGWIKTNEVAELP